MVERLAAVMQSSLLSNYRLIVSVGGCAPCSEILRILPVASLHFLLLVCWLDFAFLLHDVFLPMDFVGVIFEAVFSFESDGNSVFSKACLS